MTDASCTTRLRAECLETALLFPNVVKIEGASNDNSDNVGIPVGGGGVIRVPYLRALPWWQQVSAHIRHIRLGLLIRRTPFIILGSPATQYSPGTGGDASRKGTDSARPLDFRADR